MGQGKPRNASAVRFHPFIYESLPRYGAQHRQGALWKDGIKGLPPQWWQYKELDGTTIYQDDALMMASRHRPLPGVRLDDPGQLVHGCEWHISPFGRSYFVNHNTKTTSWKKPTPDRPPGSLSPECVIEGHSKIIRTLTCVGASCNLTSTSDDGSIRRWTGHGEPVGKPWNSDAGVISIAKSPDETLVISGSANGVLRLWNIEEGTMVGDPWEGHDGPVNCLHWSPNTLEVASGSQDGIIRRWNPDTGRQIAPLIETSHGCVYAVKYSPQNDKFTSGGEDKVIRVWSKDGELLMEIKGHDRDVMSLCWSKDGAHIFSASYDNTIRKWRSIDGEELVVFRGHTYAVDTIHLSPDERHLVSASSDCSVRIWDLETNQPVGDPLLHDDGVLALAIFPDGKYIASGGLDAKIYVWSMEAALKQQGNNSADGSSAELNANLKGCPARPRHQPVNRGLATYGEDFWDDDPTPSHAASPANSSSALRNFLSSLRFSIRPANTPQSIPLQARRWNFNLFPVGNSVRTVDVAAGRKTQRKAISPPTAAKLAKDAKRRNGSKAGGLTQPDQPQAVPGTQSPQGRPTVAQGASGGMEEVSCEVRCCSLFFSCGRPTSHQR